MSRHRLLTNILLSGVYTSSDRALISLSALHRLTSSTSSLTIDTPSTKIKGANVVAGLKVFYSEAPTSGKMS